MSVNTVPTSLLCLEIHSLQLRVMAMEPSHLTQLQGWFKAFPAKTLEEIPTKNTPVHWPQNSEGGGDAFILFAHLFIFTNLNG